MKSYYLIKQSNIIFNNHLAEEFISNEILPDLNRVEKLLLIKRHLQKLEISNGEIKNMKLLDGELVYSIIEETQPNKMTKMKIIKKLNDYTHSYEIRLNEKELKHRILFFFSSNTENKNLGDFLTLTYGFSKGNSLHDYTDSLGNLTNAIKNIILQNNSTEMELNKWMGDVWNEF